MGVQQTSISRHGKRLAAVLGLTAAASMITLSIVSSNSGGQAESVLAGSGDTPGGGMYTQPVVPGMQVGATRTQVADTGMKVGATQTPTTPAGAPATEKAAPVLKAHG
jgi:hypothetical protein